MSKRAKYLEIIRSPKPNDIDDYIKWLEARFEAMSKLRLLDMSDNVIQVVNVQRRQSAIVRERWERERIEAMNEQVDEEPETEAPQPERKPRSTAAYVYLLKVLGHDKLYKIGRTKNPDNRIRTFSVKLPYRVEYDHIIKTEDMYRLEDLLHRKYRKQRQRGSEFFLLNPDDVEYIKSVNDDTEITYERVNIFAS